MSNLPTYLRENSLKIPTIDIGKDWVFGTTLSAPKVVHRPDGQWDEWLVEKEAQDARGFDPLSCASYGTHNAGIEILAKFLFGKDLNFSDRWLAAVTGTKEKGGNDPHFVAEWIRSKGTVKEELWPFNVNNFNDYYITPPLHLNSEATKFLSEYNFRHEYVGVSHAQMKEALKGSPLGASVFAWPHVDAEGRYYKLPGETDNHWTTIYGYVEGEYWKVFDSAEKTTKKLHWNSLPVVVKRYYLEKQTEKQKTHWDWVRELVNRILARLQPPPAPTPIPTPTPAPEPIPEPPAPKYDWSTPEKAKHSVRVICDEEGLTLEQKNTLCATVGGESGWNNKAINHNKKNGKIVSTDHGVAQINSYYHIGVGKSFPSVAYVYENPDEVIRWMCKQWKLGNRNWWIAYKNSSYKNFL